MQETESFTDPKAERTSASDILKANALRTLMIECVQKITFVLCFYVNINNHFLVYRLQNQKC
jgi:hypothetical protein